MDNELKNMFIIWNTNLMYILNLGGKSILSGLHTDSKDKLSA